MLDLCTYFVSRACFGIVSLIPLGFLFRLGQLLGWAVWLLAGNYRRLARRNLEIAFGDEKSEAEIRRLTRRHFQRLGGNLLCSGKTSAMPSDQVVARVRTENVEAVHAELRSGRPVVLLLSHLSNWELLAQLFPAHFGSVRTSTIYQKLRNSRIDRDLRKRRTRSGLEMFDRSEGFQAPVALLRSGGVLGILSDQHAGDAGLWTPFFGRMASTSPLAALLAKRTGAAVIATAIYTEGAGRWRMVFSPRLDRTGDSVEALTARANEVIEEQIRSAPEDWFWIHNRWKTPRPKFLLTNYKRGIYVPPALSAAQMKPFRILIRGTNWLGDSVISAAAVRAIKRGRPDAHITVAAPAKLAAVWKRVPEVDEILSLPTSALFATARIFRRQERFDAAILFPNSLRSALEVWLAGVPRRVGYRGHRRAWFLNQIVPGPAKPGPIEHQVNHYLRLAQYLGAELSASAEISPQRNAAPLPLKLGLCAGAEYGPAKRWLPERFAEVAAAVATQTSAQWILFGTAAETDIGKGIAETLGDNCVNRIGQTTIEELIRELSQCRLLLTNDTGTMHLATLLGVPVVAIFGSTEHRLTGPLDTGHTVMRHHVECSPCFLRECPIDFRCMKAVTSEEVIAAVLKTLANTKL